ncbi:unnamed protein product [Angiostrongylus costaricensis]|uniref:FERM domain-containing protein n=1 Tax=Angiostrongylus costaricensis TaxID=334426 RepID=A0A158PJP4_ANGCS|nr:unnamed protein product [Angiostrongylus costaricensis]
MTHLYTMSYQKSRTRCSTQSASVIMRMVESSLSKRKFRRSLIEYLNKYAYVNAKGSHLWEIVEKQAVLHHGISLQNVANAYIKQPGCPMVFVTFSGKELTVHNQTRYFFYHEMRDDTKWTIPIHYRTDSQPKSRLEWVRAAHNKVS